MGGYIYRKPLTNYVQRNPTGFKRTGWQGKRSQTSSNKNLSALDLIREERISVLSILACRIIISNVRDI